MQAWVNKIWYQQHWLKWPLLPLSWLFAAISQCRRCLFNWGIKSQTQMDVPVIIVGNITAGGSGKTPTVIYLIELLRKQGYTPGVISRGYGVKIDGVKWVTPDSLATEVGDEPALIVNRTQVPMVVGSQRVSAAKHLLANSQVDVIISDDGLQHYALGRDIEIALVDGQRRYGNQCYIPAGPLRESTSRNATIDWVINNGGEPQGNEVPMSLIASPLMPVNAQGHKASAPSSKVAAIAGIGNPQRFFDSLTQQGFELTQTQAFEDHQAFDASTLLTLAANQPLIMTEKDAVKCREFADKDWWYLPVNAKLPQEFDQAILHRLAQVVQLKKES